MISKLLGTKLTISSCYDPYDPTRTSYTLYGEIDSQTSNGRLRLLIEPGNEQNLFKWPDTELPSGGGIGYSIGGIKTEEQWREGIKKIYEVLEPFMNGTCFDKEPLVLKEGTSSYPNQE